MAIEEKIPVYFVLNGRKVQVDVPPYRTLLELLRRDFALISPKAGCAKGECGACTVILNGKPVNSCLKLAAQLKPVDAVNTLEGLQNEPLMKKIQTSFVEEGAVQCGFCTPGMVMSAYALLKQHPKAGEEKIKEALSGNLCRCTGYTKILTAVRRAREEGA